MYTITVESPFRDTETHTRARRDAASLLFRRAAYDVLKANALLDRPIAQRTMKRAEEACEPNCAAVSVELFETVIRFRAA